MHFYLAAHPSAAVKTLLRCDVTFMAFFHFHFRGYKRKSRARLRKRREILFALNKIHSCSSSVSEYNYFYNRSLLLGSFTFYLSNLFFYKKRNAIRITKIVKTETSLLKVDGRR